MSLSFFIGKGGVGKTTVSAAYAASAAAAHPRRRVLVLSTDPAHSLGDVLQLRLGATARRVKLPRGQLFAWEIDAQRQFNKFLGRYREQILNVVESGTLFSRAEIEPLLDTTLPGMAEVAALLTLHQVMEAGTYDEIVVDTAPVGHTLRLFEMPQHFARFLDFLDAAGSRDRILAQRFGGRVSSEHPFIGEWRRIVQQVQKALTAPDSGLVLITTPETFALNESVRAAEALARNSPGLRVRGVVLNRMLAIPGKCSRCARRARDSRAAGKFLARNFPGLEVWRGEDPGGPVLGPAALLDFGRHAFAGKKLSRNTAAPRASAVGFKPTSWPKVDAPLSLTIGKGGVGKTTISASLAFSARTAQHAQVVICSTDPAPSLDDVFQAEVGDTPRAVLGDRALKALEIDSVAGYHAWSKDLKSKLDRAFTTDKSGLHVDLSFDRGVIEALLDIVPPGVDEILAIFRILDLLEGAPPEARVIIDMAPTGHSLELLRMPDRMLLWARLLLKSLAPHRTLPLAQDLAVEIAALSQRVRELAQTLKSRRRSQVWVVMLAEPLPDRETQRLLAALDELGVQVSGLFVNRLIFDADPCRRCARARAWQMQTLSSLRKKVAVRELLAVREFEHEIAGAKALRVFTGELWRIA